ncbi:MAG TPA: helicase-exonuclease AddAB subunit AddA [Sedimentisphaerales bacterium]|nr:helicase-exonuclease AddAB subunit AddA [Sedimentisphaerales bacterium]
MAQRRTKWTQQQIRAIAARGSDVLVTASAGTGKTALLSGRCADIVCDRRLCPDVCSILVLTFTDAAAEQMRSRIAEQLEDAFLEKKDPHLRRQLLLLQGADISTIHSFCKRLITEYFYRIGLDPTFRVVDADEAGLLKAEALEKTIDWAWRQSNLTQGLRQLFYRRDLRTADGFLAKIIALSDFLDGVVSRENWYERATVLAEAVNPVAGTLGERQRQIIRGKLQHILAQLQHARRLYESQKADGGWAAECEQTFIEPVCRCLQLLKDGDWNGFSNEILNFEKPTVRKPKGVSAPVDELIRSVAKKAMAEFENLSELAVLNPEYLDRVSGAAGLQTKVLIELVKRFDRLYSQAKRVLNCLDFADLEHYALRLLSDESPAQDKPQPSETALALRKRYKYIFVDEYQDINGVQQAILDLLSEGGNVFVVGDIKQSIYAWRGAEPDIFIEHLKQASPESAGATGGLRVDLNVNFRSSKGILDFVNKVFGRIMTASFTKLDYDESARLRPAPAGELKTPPAGETEPIVELHILDELEKDAGAEDDQTGGAIVQEDASVISSRQRQAALIARRIRQIVGADTGKAEFQIYDKRQDKLRDVEYRDIVVLMRSLAKKASDYVEVFRLAGVPVSCDAVAGYFEATEISDLLCLMKVLDNPQRDIELAAVLRSPLFGVSDAELAKIKIRGKNHKEPGNFYDCLRAYCVSGPDEELAGKLKSALARIERWRTAARRGSLADLIWQIYRETGFLSFVCALPNGQARRANLLKLHDRAIQFEGFASSGGIASLTRFVEFIEKLQELGQDWAPAEPDSSAQNAVRILSVHKSKGLEFPVVFIAELNTKFNKRDIYDDCLADSNNALGLQIIDRQSNSKLRSLAHQVIAEEKLATALAEEMRILYVATTRARDRLILTASQKGSHCRDIVCNGLFFGEGPVADWQLRRCQSPLAWVLCGLSDQKNLHEVLETGLADEARDDGLFSVKLYDQAELQQLSDYILRLKAGASGKTRAAERRPRQRKTEGKLLSRVKESLAWRYKFGDAPVLPAKLSVTQLTHRSDEYVRFDYSRALERRPAVLSAGLGDIVGPVEGRLVGAATHLVIAQLDLTRPINKKVIEQTKGKLLAAGAMTETVAESIKTEGIIKFFESDLGRRIREAENAVWREWPFTFAIPACELSDALEQSRVTDDELIIVQGIIDMLVKTTAGLLVIDFKTDRVTEAEVPQRAELYRGQLEHYSRAAGIILNTQILGKWLYFLTPGSPTEI